MNDSQTDLDTWLLESFDDSATVINPDFVGELSGSESNEIQQFVEFLCEFWGLSIYLPALDDRVTNFLFQKSNFSPSYFTEYRNAAALLARVKRDSDSVDQGYTFVALEDLSTRSELNRTRLGRFRRYLFNELVIFLIAEGGFKRFTPPSGVDPAKNYKGFVGGTFIDTNNLPYRGIVF